MAKRDGEEPEQLGLYETQTMAAKGRMKKEKKNRNKHGPNKWEAIIIKKIAIQKNLTRHK